MTTAYEAVLPELGLVDRTDPLTEIVAQRIIEIFEAGEHDPNACASVPSMQSEAEHGIRIVDSYRPSSRSTFLRLVPTFLTALFTRLADLPAFFAS
jgi:hypothetical protein